MFKHLKLMQMFVFLCLSWFTLSHSGCSLQLSCNLFPISSLYSFYLRLYPHPTSFNVSFPHFPSRLSPISMAQPSPVHSSRSSFSSFYISHIILLLYLTILLFSFKTPSLLLISLPSILVFLPGPPCRAPCWWKPNTPFPFIACFTCVGKMGLCWMLVCSDRCVSFR